VVGCPLGKIRLDSNSIQKIGNHLISSGSKEFPMAGLRSRFSCFILVSSEISFPEKAPQIHRDELL
jgi:hypothetical protein